MRQPQSEETKRKISEKARERWANPKFKARVAKKIGQSAKEVWERPGYKEKMSIALKGCQAGEKNPMFRKKHSEETRAKMRASHNDWQIRERHPMWGRKHSEETREKMRASHNDYQSGEGHPMYGKHHTEEAKKKMIAAHLGIPLSEKHKKKIGKASKRTWATIDEEKKNEWRKKIGDGNKGKIVSIESRKKISAAKKGKRVSPATEFKKGMKHSHDHLKYMSKVMSALWRDPKYVKKMAKAFHITPNKPETFMINLLNDLYPGEWKYTGDLSFTINGKCPDFVNCNGQKKCIEIFGNYWHKNEDPQNRINAFKPFGYETLVIWERELKDVDSIIKRIHEFMVK